MGADDFDDQQDAWLMMQGSSYYDQVFKAPKCECGATIAMGKDDHYSHHSLWCEIRKLGDKENAT